MAPRVLISDALSPAAVAIFKEARRRGRFSSRASGKVKRTKLAGVIGGFDGLAVRSVTQVTAKLLERATRLKVIGRAGIGVDNVDIPAATAKGIIVMNTPFGNSITTAEHAIALMFALARQIPEADLSTQAGKWEKNRFMGVGRITGKVLGIIGCGNIGSISSPRARLACTCRSSPTIHFLSSERALDLGIEKVQPSKLFSAARISSTLPHAADGADQEHFVQQGKSCQDQERACGYGNCARGGLADERGLACAAR